MLLNTKKYSKNARDFLIYFRPAHFLKLEQEKWSFVFLDKCKNRKMSREEPSSGIDPSLIAAALGDISSDDEPVLPSKRRCRKRKSASPSPPVSPIHKSDSDDEGPSLADRYKERLANEIKKNLEKISNMEKAMVEK